MALHASRGGSILPSAEGESRREVSLANSYRFAIEMTKAELDSFEMN
jgi:hypothetical protein